MFPPRLVMLIVILGVTRACSPAPSLVDAAAADMPGPSHYKTVLLAGDGRLPVFDNAIKDMADLMVQTAASDPADIHELTARQGGNILALLDPAAALTRSRVLRQIASMNPSPGEGCFVYATSHGSPGAGLWLQPTNEFLSPAALDRALQAGCGGAPTVVVMSGCFTGIFAQPPMTRPNRVILTAARPDRTSFGCGAGRTYTVYDACLLDSMAKGGTWETAYAAIRACVVAEERREGATPSEPQAYFGVEVTNLRLPTSPAPASAPQ